MSIFNPTPGATYGTATIDFGALPGGNETSVVVTGQGLITATSKIFAFIMASDTSSNHTANDHRYFGTLATISCGNIAPGTGFTIYAMSIYNLTGTWTIRYFWI